MSISESAKEILIERLKALNGADEFCFEQLAPMAVDDAEAAVRKACKSSIDGVVDVHECEAEPQVSVALKQFILDTKAVRSFCKSANIHTLHFTQHPPKEPPCPPASPPPWAQRLLDNHSNPQTIRTALVSATAWVRERRNNTSHEADGVDSITPLCGNGNCAEQQDTYRLSDTQREVIIARILATQKLAEGFIGFVRVWVGEMERFLLLKAAVCDTEAEILSPSGYVDAAWHELILETRMYRMHCQKLLNMEGGFIHHIPDGAMDSDRGERYRRTYEMYNTIFGEKPPDIAWDRPEPPEILPKPAPKGDCKEHGSAESRPTRC